MRVRDSREGQAVPALHVEPGRGLSHLASGGTRARRDRGARFPRPARTEPHRLSALLPLPVRGAGRQLDAEPSRRRGWSFSSRTRRFASGCSRRSSSRPCCSSPSLSGAVADRLPKRRLLIATQTTLACQGLLLALLVATGPRGVLARGSCWARPGLRQRRRSAGAPVLPDRDGRPGRRVERRRPQLRRVQPRPDRRAGDRRGRDRASRRWRRRSSSTVSASPASSSRS